MIKVIINETNDCRESYASLVGVCRWQDEVIEITNEVSGVGWVNLFMSEDLVGLETADRFVYFSMEDAVDELERLFG